MSMRQTGVLGPLCPSLLFPFNLTMQARHFIRGTGTHRHQAESVCLEGALLQSLRRTLAGVVLALSGR